MKVVLTPWPTIEAYGLAHRCPTCQAAPGADCVMKRPKHGARMHTTREDRGAAHYYRDIGRAPWPEDRMPGRRYDTLDSPR
jgi:hypothetical protein